jgi:hypothetical protein
MNAIESTKYRKRLEEGGVPPEQVLGHADALAEVLQSLATREWVEAFVKEQLATLKVDMLKWMFSMFIAQTGILLAAIRYLPH